VSMRPKGEIPATLPRKGRSYSQPTSPRSTNPAPLEQRHVPRRPCARNDRPAQVCSEMAQLSSGMARVYSGMRHAPRPSAATPPAFPR
jgi:hypothetical protein